MLKNPFKSAFCPGNPCHPCPIRPEYLKQKKGEIASTLLPQIYHNFNLQIYGDYKNTIVLLIQKIKQTTNL